MRTLIKFSISALVLLLSSSSRAAPGKAKVSRLRIAAASDLKFAMPELVESFGKSHPGVQVETVMGASGAITQQIESGAPFDLFLSADDSFPRTLKKNGKIEGDVFQYGTGQLVLFIRKTVQLSPRRETQPGSTPSSVATSLLDPAIRKFAIANPAVAPYGRAATEALELAQSKNQMKDRLKAKIVMGESVVQAAQFALLGSVDAALIARSLADSPQMKLAGSYIAFPTGEAPQLKPSGAILASSKSKEQAREFRDFLLTTAGQTLLANHGLQDK